VEVPFIFRYPQPRDLSASIDKQPVVRVKHRCNQSSQNRNST